MSPYLSQPRTCPGCGYVAVFDQRGLHLKTLEGRGRLNAPWGMAIAPANFGQFGNALLVGNFGDCTIGAFDLATGQQFDYLHDSQGNVVAIDGLWAIFFGNGASLGRADFLYWTAGFNGETDGGFGRQPSSRDSPERLQPVDTLSAPAHLPT